MNLVILVFLTTVSCQDVVEIIGGSNFDNAKTEKFVNDIVKFISKLEPFPDITMTFRPLCGNTTNNPCTGEKQQLAKNIMCVQEYLVGYSLESVDYLYKNKNEPICDEIVKDHLKCGCGSDQLVGPIATKKVFEDEIFFIRDCSTSAEGDKLVKKAQKKKPNPNGGFSIVINTVHTAHAALPTNVAEILCPLDSIRDYPVCADVICVVE